MKFKDWLEQKIKDEWKPSLRHLVIMVFGFGFSLFLYWQEHQSQPMGSPKKPISTFIPSGFVLVPILVENFASLDQILGRFGVVDLYHVGTDPQKPAQLVAKNIKLLRSPAQNDQFGVLAPEDRASDLVKMTGPFRVVVQNPDSTGTEFVKGSRRRIIYREKNQ